MLVTQGPRTYIKVLGEKRFLEVLLCPPPACRNGVVLGTVGEQQACRHCTPLTVSNVSSSFHLHGGDCEINKWKQNCGKKELFWRKEEVLVVSVALTNAPTKSSGREERAQGQLQVTIYHFRDRRQELKQFPHHIHSQEQRE